MQKIAVFPGSFDPVTIGHYSLIIRALPLFDQIVVAIGNNNDKTGFFSVDDRMKWIKEIFANEPRVSVTVYKGLTVDYCRSINAGFLLRGLRTSADFEFERTVGQVNKKLHPEIETVFLLTAPEHSYISSSIVREIIKNGGDPSQFLPAGLVLKNISI
jgi:pantetheine-phosphate adenylyltransferase